MSPINHSLVVADLVITDHLPNPSNQFADEQLGNSLVETPSRSHPLPTSPHRAFARPKIPAGKSRTRHSFRRTFGRFCRSGWGSPYHLARRVVNPNERRRVLEHQRISLVGRRRIPNRLAVVVRDQISIALKDQAARMAVIAAAVGLVGLVGPLRDVVLVGDKVVIELEAEEDAVVEGQEARVARLQVESAALVREDGGVGSCNVVVFLSGKGGAEGGGEECKGGGEGMVVGAATW